MSKKLYDLAVKTGEYTDGQGQKKGRWQNVGAVMQWDDGNKSIVLERWFNPAGVPNPDHRGNVMLSMFEPKQHGQQQAPSGSFQQPQAAPVDDFDNDMIPF